MPYTVYEEYNLNEDVDILNCYWMSPISNIAELVADYTPPEDAQGSTPIRMLIPIDSFDKFLLFYSAKLKKWIGPLLVSTKSLHFNNENEN